MQRRGGLQNQKQRVTERESESRLFGERLSGELSAARKYATDLIKQFPLLVARWKYVLNSYLLIARKNATKSE